MSIPQYIVIDLNNVMPWVHLQTSIMNDGEMKAPLVTMNGFGGGGEQGLKNGKADRPLESSVHR